MTAVNTIVDYSGTTSSSTLSSTVALPANPTRNGFFLQNNGSSTIWINLNGPATAAPPSIAVTAGSYYETSPGFPCQGIVTVLSDAASQAYTAKEW